MADEAVWQPLVGELQRWRQAGRAADLWLRDDDAIEPTAALDRLLALAGRHSIPLTLAVIPALCRRSTRRQAFRRAPRYGRGAWLGASQPRAARRQEGRARGAPAGGDRACRAFSGQGRHRSALPRKQRADPGSALEPHRLEPRAAALRARLCGPCRSTARQSRRRSGIVNTHVDIVDWQAGKACRDHAALVGQLVEELGRRLASGSPEPVGILTHHLVHDEAALGLPRTIVRGDRRAGRLPLAVDRGIGIGE